VVELASPVASKELTWRLLDPKGNASAPFTRTVKSRGLTKTRTSFVEGVVPAEISPGTYTLELTVSTPSRAPLVERTSVDIRKAPLVVQSVALSPSNGANAAAVASATAGVRLYMHAVYAAEPAVGKASRRLSWRVTNARGESVPELSGSERVKGKGAGRFVRVVEMKIPSRLATGSYQFQFSVESGGERAQYQVTLEVRKR
jgi:hypothetical protein